MADDYQAAALRDPCFRFMHRIYTSIGNPPHEIERFRAQSADARAKAEAMSDRKWRKAYLGWCDYIDRQIAKSVEADAEGPSRRERYEKDCRAREAATADLLSRNPPH